MSDNGLPVKDPVTPEHKRFVLNQASLRLWIAGIAALALAAWFFVKI